MNALPWFLLVAPLLSAVVIFATLLRSPKVAAGISIGACAISFAIALGLKFGSLVAPVAIPWITLPGLAIEIGFNADALAQMMLLVVTGVGLLVHIYSFAYMDGDKGQARFFAELSLFMFSMLGIVIATNFIQMFIFWELVGLSSYLLIGFWFEKKSAADAAKKAFLVNRIGDFGFLVGIITFWGLTGTLFFDPATWTAGGDSAKGITSLVDLQANPKFATLIHVMGFGLFMGCMGKSAMVPLHVWLPDAMEGPTPVSALIHAATMVAAGVYMICRIYPVLAITPLLMTFIAAIGLITLLFAAVIALQQDDIKRILAYSTLSQLGYMVMAVGLGAPAAAMFHLTTHAFFKALLFLGAGSVIHAMHHEQDIWKMGGLWKKIPLTFWTFVVGTAALTGFPFLAGFFSKEEILMAAWHGHPFHFGLAALTAALTSFYMFRLFFVTFFGECRSEDAKHAHESPAAMWLPLVILAIPSVIAGFGFVGIGHAFHDFFHHAFPAFIHAEHSHEGAGIVMSISIVAFLAGLGAAAAYYLKGPAKDPMPAMPPVQNKFYIDYIYDNAVLGVQAGIARMLNTIDYWLLGTIFVRGSATFVSIGGELLRLFQTGNMQTYAFLFSLGAALLFYYILFLI
ncbi:NADH-quinone oxidoreductase subunit L [Verrucomicrobia bacterium LW23]|nr:NADH-quinone oxidoreductase subunit L [Verrucomicrobia bacterium LW23]